MLTGPVTEDQVLTALSTVKDPELRQDLVTLNMVREITISPGGLIAVAIDLTTAGCPLKRQIQDDVTVALLALDGILGVTVDFGVMSTKQKERLQEQLRGGRAYRKPGLAIPPTCRVIAVASGKGGVGKSTVTANLAAAMALRGHEVGILDADVYGYSVPQMLGIRQRPVIVEEMIVPPVSHGVRLMSIGFFLDEDEPIMWRGPMLHRAIEQFLGDVHWGDIEYLFIDMPPGTGDVAITLAQLLPGAEVIVVTTPQTAAQIVAKRSATTATRLDQNVIGIIENMSGTAEQPSIFGAGGGQLLADDVEVPLLGSVPLDGAIREGGDAGVPIVTSVDAATSPFMAIADRIAAIEPPPLPPQPLPDPVSRIKAPLAVL